MEILDRAIIKYGNRLLLACLLALFLSGPATIVSAQDSPESTPEAVAQKAATVAQKVARPDGAPVNMAAWSNIARVRILARSNPDKVLRELTRALDDAQGRLASLDVEVDLFAAVELRLFDVETPDQELKALQSTLAAWEEIEHSASAQILLPVIKNRLAELVMEPAETPAQ